MGSAADDHRVNGGATVGTVGVSTTLGKRRMPVRKGRRRATMKGRVLGQCSACGHGRWGRDAAVSSGREIRGLKGHIRQGGMVEVVGAGPRAVRDAGVRSAHRGGVARQWGRQQQL
jgi:hypothetical protein